MAPPRFAVDKMLGRLATWLRLLGLDATYGAHLSGRTLLRHARDEDRVILTRDRRLLRMPQAPPLLFITSDHFREQLRQVIAAYALDPFAGIFSRCSRCNAPLHTIPKDAAADHVPPYVLSTQEHFVRCPGCRRIYWPATHAQHVRTELHTLGFAPGAPDAPVRLK